MRKLIGTIGLTLATALIAIPAAAGSWPDLPARKALAPSAQVKGAAQRAPAKSLDGFVVQDGESISTLEPVRYFTNEEKETIYVARVKAGTAPVRDVVTTSANGFEYIGGEIGWQPSNHKLVWSAGRFVHSDQCDHVIRSAKAATPTEMESTNAMSPGA